MLARRDPFRELNELNETFNRFFDSALGQRMSGEQGWSFGSVPLDVIETENGYVVKAALPGINPDELDITYSNNVLTIKGEVVPDKEEEPARYHLRERWYGKFQRSLVLPAKVMSENIQADYDAGVLTLFLPKSEEVKPKRIAIKSGTGQQSKMIEGKYSNN